MMDPSVPGRCKARLSLDRNECQLLPLKEAVNLRQKELLSLATKEGRMERKDEWGQSITAAVYLLRTTAQRSSSSSALSNTGSYASAES